ncbi:hypothetical protein QUB57_27080 [Microcoleus sp. F6_C1]
MAGTTFEILGQNAPCPMPHAPCPMPNARCPMPNAQSPRVPHLPEKG